MEYLTTHDLVWINNVVTGAVNPFNYVPLEAAIASQYGYGDSRDVEGQAANFLDHLLSTAPFASGNRRTAFIALLTFLNANGYATKQGDPDAVQTVQSVAQRQRTPQEAIDALAAPAKEPLLPGITLRTLITHECNLHAEALKLLSEGD